MAQLTHQDMGSGYTQKSAYSWHGLGFLPAWAAFLIAVAMYLTLEEEGFTLAHSFRGSQFTMAEKVW